MPEFNAEVDLVAIKNDEAIGELVDMFEVHPNMINNWRKSFFKGLHQRKATYLSPGQSQVKIN